MSRQLIEKFYQKHVDDFVNSFKFKELENGNASREQCWSFVASICQTHLRSPKIVSFLYALAPANADESFKHNVLEEMGLEEENGVSHPQLLRNLGDSCGFTFTDWIKISKSADERLRDLVLQPLLFGTLRDVGLNVMIEVVGFEWMLSRLASRMGRALQTKLGLSNENLAWFFHHSEVDIGHAEQGIQSILDYIRYYDVDSDTLETILEITFRENLFTKRYFAQ